MKNQGEEVPPHEPCTEENKPYTNLLVRNKGQRANYSVVHMLSLLLMGILYPPL